MAKSDIIHQIDSIFGILLVALIFLSNITMNLAERHASPQDSMLDMVIVALGLLTSAAVLMGLFGMLTKSWNGKLLGWFLALWVVLWNIGLEFSFVAGLLMGLSRSLIITVISLLPPVLALVVTFYVVLDEYRNRLASGFFRDDYLEGIVTYRKWVLVFGPACALFAMLFLIRLWHLL